MEPRCCPELVATLRKAAELQGQDLTSFVLGAARERARSVLRKTASRLPRERDPAREGPGRPPTVVPQWLGSSAACEPDMTLSPEALSIGGTPNRGADDRGCERAGETGTTRAGCSGRPGRGRSRGAEVRGASAGG
ncbi:MAG: DUF1778 domain-containing protein [Brooklawnia sp.]|nr:DUF1778 domain-containing protein [Brooklawnia sp.]